jgi:hypothetical protein
MGYSLESNKEKKRSLCRPRRSWMDNIKIVFGETGWGDVELIGEILWLR